MKNKRIELLAHKWLDDKISSEEVTEFNQWYNTGLDQPIMIRADYAQSDEQLRARIYQVIERNIHRKRRSGVWIRTVAAIFLALNLGVGIYLYSDKDQEVVVTSNHTAAIQPGSDKATLILSDGQRILLSDAQNGKLVNQAGVAISKTSDGQLVYHITADGKAQHASKIAYNTIETPRGGQYQVVLPDGTHVWLNAASSFHYPTSFPASGSRAVTLTYGEAYFEVRHNPEQPFTVSSGRQELEVLGTHFNISAYPEEGQVKTTLLVGSVRVTDKLSKEEVLLRPGQQASLSGAGIQIKTLDGANRQLWKDGKFTFDNERIGFIMQQLARWYQIKVVYQDPVQDVRLTGSVSRFDQLATLLEKLEQTGLVSFKREGDQLVVMKGQP